LAAPLGIDLQTAATAGLAIVVAQGLPRAIRTIYRSTSAALFSSLSGIKGLIAMAFSAAALIWTVTVVAAVYTPLAAVLPRYLPFPDAVVETFLLFEVPVLVLLPVGLGVVEMVFVKGTLAQRLSMIPRAYVHTPAIGLALLALVPWITWRTIAVPLTRRKVEQLKIEIDPERYDTVADSMIAALRGAGLTATKLPLPPPIAVSRWFLHKLGPPLLRPRSEYKACRIVGNGYSLLVYDGLIDAVAERRLTSRIRSGVIGAMPPAGLWLTRSEEGRKIEELIRTDGADLSDVPRQLAELDVPLDEWRILSWEYVLVLSSRRRVV
jgi:hypothetical protein